MANTKSAKKAARQAEKRTLINKSRRTRMRTFVRKVEEAIASGDKAAANLALREAQPEIMRSASKGIIHRNTASRKISRLSARIKALSEAA
jgi:small subunit ribosomal protein S20